MERKMRIEAEHVVQRDIYFSSIFFVEAMEIQPTNWVK